VVKVFEAAGLLFLYVETPLHAGTGRGLAAVDLPIQRERCTGYPIVQATSLKGKLRSATDPRASTNPALTKEEHTAIFGPEGQEASRHAGALAVVEARLLLFPVRSVAGVFAWTTSRDVLARFARDAQLTGLACPWQLPPAQDRDQALVSGDALVVGGSLVLQEFALTANRQQADTVRGIGQWLAEQALPETSEYGYWRNALPDRLCIVHEDIFRHLVLYATDVQTHVRLDIERKTVEERALWTSESLPCDTLLYAPIFAARSRRPGLNLSGKEILARLRQLGITRTQLGGDETTGQGVVAVRFVEGGAP
jgi:CRISPR-associated protein Cmr4